ncbi:hypothetical protein BCR44DRAFT_40994 [Catenaria anguillulae PL171]|uniref:Uncharacterized protein n=1 Tax=Catenaria anguillulae PL171 TaxID=765915 RepID=A0A1Y2HK81_9FUNG|nr:hypothetical protein BCR44DRAFT_40994 [Catenaria anguillulae PL171]
MYFRSATLTIALVALAASSTPSLAQGYYGGDAAAAPAPSKSASAIAAPSAAPTANYDYGGVPVPIATGSLPTATAALPPPTTTMYPGGNYARAPGSPIKVVVTHNGQEYTVTVPAVPGLSDIPCCGERDGVDPTDNDAEGIFCRQLRAELAKVPACSSLAAAGAIDADMIEEDEAPPAAGAGSDEAKPAVQPPTDGKTEEKKPTDGSAAPGNGQQVQAASASSARAGFQVTGAKLLGTVGAGLVVAGAFVTL